MKIIFSLLLCILFFNSVFAFQSESISEPEEGILNIQRIEQVSDSLAKNLMNDHLLTGMSVAVAKGGKIMFSEGYGVANIELDVKATPETVYKIASITKQFTAAMVLSLVQEGKMELDDPLEKFFPEYPAHGAAITVRNLLNHTSGIGSEKYKEEVEKVSARRKSLYALSEKELLDMFIYAPLEFAPGEQFAYRNQNYILLGMIISKVTGMSYPQYADQFFKSVGLGQTKYCDQSSIIKGRAQGYEINDSKFYNAPFLNMNNPGAAGGLCSTVGDLVLWNTLLHSGRIINKKYLQEMTTPAILNNGRSSEYGLGLKLGKLGENKKIYHGGSINGFNSVLEFYPEQDLTIVVMTNTGSEKDEVISEALARAALGIEMRTKTLAAEERTKYEGTYSLEVDDKILDLRFFQKNDQLMVDFAGEGVSPLLYQGNGKFVVAFEPGIEFVFLAEPGGKFDLQVNIHGNDLQASRK